MSGEINTPKEVIEIRKIISSMLEIIPEEIEEAEIIEDYEKLMKIEFEEIMNFLSNVEGKSIRSKKNLDALIKIKKILIEME